MSKLFAFELGRIKSGMYKNSRDIIYPDEVKLILEKSNIVSYTYGAARIGNPEYKKIYDKLVPCTFRIINNMDIIPRLPRSSMLTRYEPVGRTVIINSANSSIWIEGESEGLDPSVGLNPIDLMTSVEEKKIIYGNIEKEFKKYGYGEVFETINTEQNDQLSKAIEILLSRLSSNGK